MSVSRGLRRAHPKETEMGDDNPNIVRVGDQLEMKIRTLTHLMPNHQLDPSDVFIVGYMKSGTTWFRNLAAGVVYGLTSEYIPYSVVWELVPNHGPTKPFYKRYQTPMYFKVHDFPRPQYKRVVFLVRDGRDVVVSLAHHLRNVYKDKVDMLELVQGRSPQFSIQYEWYKHAEAWLANPYGAQMITIRFEDLKKDPIPELRRFCEFTGLERDQAQLERAVAYASFEAMREKEQRLGMDYRTWPKDRPFVRKGEVGSHKEELSAEALALFMREGGETLRKLGYL
jgi:hypothetical protein